MLRHFMVLFLIGFAEDIVADDQALRDNLDGLTVDVLGTYITASLADSGAATVFTAQLGLDLPPEIGSSYTTCSTNDELCFEWGNTAKLSVAKSEDGICYKFKWETVGLVSNKDCVDIDTGGAVWYGGAEEYEQHFPLRKSNSRAEVAYVTGDMLQDKDMYFGGVVEPWWVSSLGVGIHVPEGIPLFYSWNDADNGRMCLSSKYEAPYFVPADSREPLRLEYSICLKPDSKEMQMYAINNLLGRPTGIPDERMMRDPVWSTWAQFKVNIDEATVRGFAADIRTNGFSDSQLEIDDNWETCYGEAIFDPLKFPNPQEMVSDLNQLGFRTTLWIHPFINASCPTWREVALGYDSYFIRDSKADSLGKHLPGITYWWQGDLAGYVDFTSATATRWWKERLENLRTETGIDSFKFDAGEANWMPSSYVLHSNTAETSTWPHAFTAAYVEAAAAFGGMIEVRVGRNTQHLPIFVRMLDKDSRWGYDNGLRTLVTTLLQMSFAGYPFVLPDMIGGNGYAGGLEDTELPSKELFVRWMQANVFMPAMQFSFVPWQYDQETIDHALAMTALHASYAPLIVELANNATTSGEPINRPVWWIDPKDTEALSMDDEFLLGDKVLVAPILDEGATTRDIYLPRGTWRDEVDPNHEEHEGPKWLRGYAADLFTLPYFTKL